MNDPPEDSQEPSPANARSPTDVAVIDPPVGGLSERAQRWNSVVFIVNTTIGYSVAPVFYIGILHAAVIHAQGFRDTVANLPEAVYMWVQPAPLLIAWLWPKARHLRPMLMVSFAAKGFAGLAVAALFLGGPKTWLAAVLVAHAGIIGVANGVTNMCQWELIGRGMTPALRSKTLKIAFGIGPLFGVLGSCGSQLALDGNLLGFVHVTPLPRPWGHVAVFGVTAPAMLLSAAIALLARVSDAPSAEVRAGPARVAIGLREYLTHPAMLVALVGFLLTTAGGAMIFPNLNLYAREATGLSPERLAGEELALRFGTKSLAGFALGWMAARSAPKTPALATTLCCLAGIYWALYVPGKWYMASFCVLGAGELFYVYYLNYIVGCSRPERMRENTAYTNVASSLIGFVPLIYGALSERFGIGASFVLAAVLLIAGATWIHLLLPPRPAPRASA